MISIMSRLHCYLERRKWRKDNIHNSTSMENLFDRSRVSVGNGTYGGLYILMHNNNCKLTIGDYCSIAPSVCFIVESDHPINQASTFPYKVKILGEQGEAISKGDIIVDDDVWIGYRSTILSGVHIGQGAVIAAGSIVSKNVPPYAIVGGIPAKVIKYRFQSDVVEFMNTLDYSLLDDETVKKHIDELYIPIENMSTEEVKELFSWFPKKKIV